MPKTRKFREPYEKMSRPAKADVEKRVQCSLQEMPIYELRAARRLTEQQLAQMSGLSQTEARGMGENTDAYLNTLENFVDSIRAGLGAKHPNERNARLATRAHSGIGAGPNRKSHLPLRTTGKAPVRMLPLDSALPPPYLSTRHK